MKIIYNKLIPFKGFRAINLFGLVFARREAGVLSPSIIRHEAIHTAQMRELLYVPFYLIYLLEWFGQLVFGFCRHRPASEAYYRISFEREAYAHQDKDGYLGRRKRWGMWR